MGLLLFFSIFGENARAAQYGIQADFVRNNTEQEVTEVASNVLRIKNYTGHVARFHLAWSVPAGWMMMGNKDKTIEIGVNDSLFIPIRIIPEKLAKGGTSYITSVMLVSDQGMQFASQNWYIRIRQHINWTAQIPVKQKFFINGNDTSSFSIHLKNDGNTDENIRMTLIPDRRVVILREEDAAIAPLNFSIDLPVGADTVIPFLALRRPEFSNRRQKDADLRREPSKETYSVQVLAKGNGKLNSWSSTMQFIKASDHAQRNEFAHAAIPLTLEANVYDMLSQGTTMAVDAYGNSLLGNNRILNYRFQSVFINNYLDRNAFLGTNHYIGYFDEKKTLEFGEINGWGRSLLTGKGIKGSYTFGKNTFGAMMTGTPGILNRSNTEGYGFYHSVRLKNLTWNNYLTQNSARQLTLSNKIYNTNASWKIHRIHQFTVGVGYSSEAATTNGALLQKAGFGYDLNYSGSFKKINFGAGTTYGSSFYAIARGITLYNGRLTYTSGIKNSYSLNVQQYNQRPGYISNGIVIDGNTIQSDRYEFRWGINTANSSVAFKPAYIYEKNPVIRVASRGIGFEYNARNIPGTRFSVTGFAGYAKVLDTNIPDFFYSRLTVSSRWNQTFFSLRYLYGASQLTEQTRFISDHINPQSLNLMSSHDHWFSEGKLLLTTTASVLYQTYFERYSLRIRPELYYYSKNGVRFSFYASFLTGAQNANPLAQDIPNRAPYESTSNTEFNMGFGVRKTIGLPVPGKKFGSAKIIVFKDLNGNGKQDKDEEGLGNVLINIKALRLFTRSEDSTAVLFGEDLVTNAKGEVYYENIPGGVYSIRTQSLIGQSEWMDGGTIETTIDKKLTIAIPLSRGIKLMGSLLVSREKYTDETPIDISRIRVTAIDSSGRTYSVLTDRKGEFSMYLPLSMYTVTINESALGDKFILQQNRIQLDLSRFTGNFRITFNAIEKRRKMEVKKFNNGKE